MHYDKLKSVNTEYQGESFNRSIHREDGVVWDDVDQATYSMVDSANVEVSSGSLTKSVDKLTFDLAVPKADTANLTGAHKLLVTLTKTDDATFSDVIAEYNITYEARTA